MFDRELLAIYMAVKLFRHFLEGRSFCFFTIHKPLTHALALHMGNTALHHIPLCLARHQCRHVSMGTFLPKLSAVEGPAAYHYPPWNFHITQSSFRQDPLRSGWTSSPVQWFRYLLRCIDCFTWWPEAIPITDMTAETVARTFISGWISRFGIPSTVTTHCGCQFESFLLAQLIQ